MEKIDIFDLQHKINKELNSQIISGKVLLDRFCLIDEDSRKTAAYLDHKYAPFYYYLGKYIKPKYFMEIGFNLGLLSGSFLTSCKTVESFFGYKEKDESFVPIRIGKANIKKKFKRHTDFYIGNFYNQEFIDIFLSNSFDLVVINDETSYDKHLEYLDTIWTNLSENGLIVADYINRHIPAKNAFFAFCESKNRKPIIFSTRYGTGILQK